MDKRSVTVESSDSRFPWMRMGYILIAILFLFRLGYIASGTIDLTQDEAYQWLWSKHLALSYFSKPPGIALIQFAGTSIWGDTQFGVRFFSPVFAAILSIVMLRFMARQVGPRLAFLLLLAVSCVPLMGVGTILMTVDPPLVLCWMLALIAGWRAVQPDGATRHWLFAGLAAGIGFLCKYNALYLIVCWALFFALWKPARAQLRKPGPYLALLIIGLCTIPVIVWNSQNGWITAHHVAGNASLGKEWHARDALRFFSDFTLAEFALLNPVFFVSIIWAVIGFWKRRQENPLCLYFFCMGVPVFFGHWIYSLHSRVQPNWIAPSIVPLCGLMLLYWDSRWREGYRSVRPWFIAGIVVGIFMIVPMHESRLIGALAGHPLPGEIDPLRRARAWKETASFVEAARKKLEAEGKPTFIIGDHYGLTGEFSFYSPEAREALKKKDPLVYYMSSATPRNQLYFWPEYQYAETRKGQNAIFVSENGPYALEKGWFGKWLKGQKVGYGPFPPLRPASPEILKQFRSVTDLGESEIKLGEGVFRRVQLFECRDLQ